MLLLPFARLLWARDILRLTNSIHYWKLPFECKRKEKILSWKHEITFSVMNSSTWMGIMVAPANRVNSKRSKCALHELRILCKSVLGYWKKKQILFKEKLRRFPFLSVGHFGVVCTKWWLSLLILICFVWHIIELSRTSVRWMLECFSTFTLLRNSKWNNEKKPTKCCIYR